MAWKSWKFVIVKIIWPLMGTIPLGFIWYDYKTDVVLFVNPDSSIGTFLIILILVKYALGMLHIFDSAQLLGVEAELAPMSRVGANEPSWRKRAAQALEKHSITFCLSFYTNNNAERIVKNNSKKTYY